MPPRARKTADARPKLINYGPFEDLASFEQEAEPKRLPWRGKVYEFPGAISGRAGVILQRMTEVAAATQLGVDAPEDPELLDTILASDDEEVTLRRQVFGDTLAELIEDGADSEQVSHFFKTLVTWHAMGEEQAVAAWKRMGPTPHQNRASRRAVATSTRKRASGTTTKRPRRATAEGTGRAGAASSKDGASSKSTSTRSTE